MEHTIQNEIMEDCIKHWTGKYFWAKTTQDGLPGCEVWQHGMAAAEVARKILERRPDYERLLPDGTITLVAVHDVGKISPGFQTKCPMWQGPDGESPPDELKKWALFYESRHALITYSVLRQYYKKCLKSRNGRVWAGCAGAHHGVPVDQMVSSKEILPDDWWTESRKLVDLMVSRYGVLPMERKIPETIQRVLTGLMIVSDWIASHEECFPPERVNVDYQMQAEQALRKIGWKQLSNLKSGASWPDLFHHCPHPRLLQQYLWRFPATSGIYVIEDAMGGGKTEAALALAYHLLEKGEAHGIYFALPTQTTSNRIFYRVRDFVRRAGIEVDEQSIQLAHGNSWLMHDSIYADETGRKAGDDAGVELRNWFSSSKRTLLVPFGVGTIDQALMGVVAVKHRDVRAFALAGKVVILDEVHSYDFYTGSLITSLVKQLRESGATVIILSATLTQSRVRELLEIKTDETLPPDYPLVTAKIGENVCFQSFPALDSKEVQVRMSELSLDGVAEHAYEIAQGGGCVLWIRNTVKDAQNAYRTLKTVAVEGGPEIGLLHARFPYWRREELESIWIDRLGRDGAGRPAGCVLVATQVVEQSVDIDADYLITDLAPTDMLLQRAGRLWRHARENRPCPVPQMFIVVPEGLSSAIKEDDVKLFKNCCSSTGKVYAPYVLYKTWNVWTGLASLSLPSSIRPLIEHTYECADTENPNIAGKTKGEMQEAIADLEAKVRLNQSFAAGTGNDADDAITRYGKVDYISALPLRCRPVNHGNGCVEYELLSGENIKVIPDKWQYRVAKCLCENVVRVPKWQVGDVMPDDRLAKYGFDGFYPFFVLDNGDLMFYTGEESMLGWNAQLGVYSLPPKEKHDEESEFMY